MSLPASDARFAAGVRLFNHRRASERAVVWTWPRYPLVSARAVVAPVEELFYRARVRQARVAVTNRRSKEFDEAAAGPLAHDADNRRQRLKPGTDQYGGGYYFVGQHDPVMASTSTKRLPSA